MRARRWLGLGRVGHDTDREASIERAARITLRSCESPSLCDAVDVLSYARIRRLPGLSPAAIDPQVYIDASVAMWPHFHSN
ncbi:hypothetical protein NUW54_g13951 [Trametes sanguinea]|uniref:Uncharacterized protein n=1 Tax=Trametes sanguinea TaxID=158606 RepID=A0ACC1MHV9_9APHY|nr:hypothetical protein NUW54_g13951 [Trametes sanguinea]